MPSQPDHTMAIFFSTYSMPWPYSFTTYCVGVPQFDAIFWNRALEREMNSFLFFKSRKKDARLSSNVYWSFNIWCAIICSRNFSSLPVCSFSKVRPFLSYPFIEAYYKPFFERFFWPPAPARSYKSHDS